ncbi:class I SAM-dependent methyltransferase [Aquiflexum sp. LQ15W]|uniref:class I SAM-dependent methyltransferase n=1 Tax=Cognataquiflexum nitidum TaxID=2922272 RepID=UPI001F136A65|nr:class I SAM-dependent methyltransferase [Cognataquiflexum nitidum]MCH6200694.1 class I SAM-dependent methyltransferase [Cognataquiflexum nitidum]
MTDIDKKQHWENIYQTKNFSEVGWYQKTPTVSLAFFEASEIPKAAKIIDVGGGDSYLVDHLLDLDFAHIHVLDLSRRAIEKAKERLDKNASKVTWINSDILHFRPKEKYDVWHDRAAFHFLRDYDEIEKYVQIANHSITKGGLMLIGTFSDQGPTYCSGLPVMQYSMEQLAAVFKPYFKKTIASKPTISPPAAQGNFIHFAILKRSKNQSPLNQN